MTNGESLQWRPIATAPRDQDVLIYSLRWGAMIATFDTGREAWVPRMRQPEQLNGNDTALLTHWMPMPGTPHALTGSRLIWRSLAA